MKNHRNLGRHQLLAIPPCQRLYTLKTTQPFFKSSCELHLTSWSFFLEIRFKVAFQSRAIENWADAHSQNCLTGKDIMLKTTQPFFKCLYEFHITLRSIFGRHYKSSARSYSSQVTCASVQLMLSDNYTIQVLADTLPQNYYTSKDIMLKLPSLSSKAIV